MPETLILGLGGVGGEVIRRLREALPEYAASLASTAGDEVPAAPPSLLWVDTDRSAASEGLLLTTNAAVLDAAYRQPERFHAEWIRREVLRQPFQEQGAGGSRMFGRFLLLLPENRRLVREQVRRWLTHTATAHARRIYVVASAAGGTGSGMLADVAYLIQSTLEAESLAPDAVDLRSVLVLPPPREAQFAGNAFATLTELHYYSDPDTRYTAHLDDTETPYVTRRPPFARVGMAPSVTLGGDVVPLPELLDRAATYLLVQTVADPGGLERMRVTEEAPLSLTDADGNPQVFTTFGIEWAQYPEERLVQSVYRNLARRSLVPWLLGDTPVQLRELPNDVPLRDPTALARLFVPAGATETEGSETEGSELLRPVQTRLPWIHNAPAHQWSVMDQEFEAALQAMSGTPPAAGKPGQGPLAERYGILRDKALGGVRHQAAEWLRRDGVTLDRVARVLQDAATELRTVTDPGAAWEEAEAVSATARKKVLWAVGALHRDPFALFGRRTAARKLALEYERLARLHVLHHFRARALPWMQSLRGEILTPLQAWRERTAELAGTLADFSRAMADQEASLLERLRREEQVGRLALGLLQLPGKETPYVANTGWDLPYCSREEEAAVIRDLRQGWLESLVESENGLLAPPHRSYLDGKPDPSQSRGPLPFLPGFTKEGGELPRVREAVLRLDYSLRRRVEERLRGWLSASAFQRLTERYRDPIQLESVLHRLVEQAAQLPALEPPHARPSGFPVEYEAVLFRPAKEHDVPTALQTVVQTAAQDRKASVVPSRSSQLLAAVTEHPGFSLAHCPPYHHFQEVCVGAETGGAESFSRVDLPWASAGLLTHEAISQAADSLYLALVFGLLHVQGKQRIPIPESVVAFPPGEQRPPLPSEFDLAVRQVAGDPALRDGLTKAVDRIVYARGVEWCALQLVHALTGELLADVQFPGTDPWLQQRFRRLATTRAAYRYEELFTEYARTSAARETDWLREGDGYACPNCGFELGHDAESLPGGCPRCRVPLLPARLRPAELSDGFRRIPNPFVVGTPLEPRSSVFFGREDIITQVRERLIRPAQRTILILIGERRCGKTSALKQLQYRLEGDLTPLFIDLQGLTASDLPGFLWWLSWRMREALEERGIHVDLPDYAQFTSGPADYQFEAKVLPEVRRKLGGGRVLLMLDEFEVLAQRVMNGTFDARAFDYIRHLMQHGEGIEFLFAGTHVLRRFAANYATFLFNIGVFLDVDFLRRDDAIRLIQDPLAPAGVTFTPEAVEAVLEYAGGHAYFTQMFGFHLVERLNRVRLREVTAQDVEEVSGPVIAAAGAHLDHVWSQLNAPERLLIAFFAQYCPQGQSCREEALLDAVTQDDPAVRPYVLRSAIEKLTGVGLLRAGSETTTEGHSIRTLALTAEVYRRWLLAAHSYRDLRDQGVAWSD